MRLIILLALLGAVSFSSAVLAAPLEIACNWRAPTITSTDAGAKEAAKFFSYPNELAYFRLNSEIERAENTDPNKTQSIIFPSLSLSVFPERYRITVREPNIAGLKGRKAAIHIDLNRYSMRSTMVLEMTERGNGTLAAIWLREGQCFKKEL